MRVFADRLLKQERINMKNTNKTRLITLTALLAAFACVATMLIRIPTPTKGYVNLGDCIVNIAGWMLGPVYGAAAAGIGSAFADIFAGYVIYAPATFVIKALMAAASVGVFKIVSGKKHSFAGRIAGAVSAEIVMIAGYFLYESALYRSFAAAAVGILPNAVQGIMGVVSSVIVYEAVVKRLPKYNNN